MQKAYFLFEVLGKVIFFNLPNQEVDFLFFLALINYNGIRWKLQKHKWKCQ